ncbi:hypothetical protein EV2_027917 [Malus domestica]|uniref:Uncharacterized protein n=1 Tax=Malus domestica TaxID=3750 RepID=A0A498KIN2_MALDO|nr:hypothetical protein DVH24_026412 [Malus domestica]
MKLRYTPLVQGFGEALEMLLGALVVSCPSMLIFVELINSFNFERDQFQAIAPPSYFGTLEKQFSDCLKLGVLAISFETIVWWTNCFLLKAKQQHAYILAIWTNCFLLKLTYICILYELGYVVGLIYIT